MVSNKRIRLYKTVLSAMFLALALVLPFVTGQIPEVGGMLCPMHIPVLLCGFFCGPWYALLIGLVAPILRFALFGMPTLMPTGICMALELGAYGFSSGFFHRLLPKKNGYVYLTLVISMLLGRAVWGVSSAAVYGIRGESFGVSTFLTAGFVNALPGIILQIIIIPVIVMALKKYTDGVYTVK